MDYMNKTALRVVYGDFTLGVHGTGFDYIFSYAQGGLESLKKQGFEWLFRCPKPTFWRALTDNDRGSGFHLKSGCWLSADLFMECAGIEVFMDGASQGFPKAPENNRYGGNVSAKEVSIKYCYRTITIPQTTVDVRYTVFEDGTIRMDVCYYGKAGLPQLPVFGMRLIMPSPAVAYTYQGLSGETYPDRKAGAESGIYNVTDLSLTPYLVPQDCGMHMDTSWLEITRNSSMDQNQVQGTKHTLRIEMKDEKFAFSCLPYTAEEIENATHQEELPPVRRTVLGIYGAVRGVGGIDSWGSDVEPAYHISGEKDIHYSFLIK